MEPIGGYFPPEIATRARHQPRGHRFNSARNALRWVLAGRDIRRLWVPDYICDSVVAAAAAAGATVATYPIGPDLLPGAAIPAGTKDAVLLVDYFGLRGEEIAVLAGAFATTIIDAAQAYFASPVPGCDMLYSPRKFLGLADGGLLVSDLPAPVDLPRDVSAERYLPGLLRLDAGPRAGYASYRRVEAELGAVPPRRMSRLTERLLAAVDAEAVRHRRETNFRRLHERLNTINEIRWDADRVRGPLAYPFLAPAAGLHAALVEQEIFVPVYWREVLARVPPSSPAAGLVTQLVALPVDQRYGAEAMQRIADAVEAWYGDATSRGDETGRREPTATPTEVPT